MLRLRRCTPNRSAQPLLSFCWPPSLLPWPRINPPRQALTPNVQAALDRISANSLRGHLSFIASDLLEGRDTPSRGLDLAAEYIAAQFRRAGLEPAGDDGYFQTANFALSEFDPRNFELTLQAGAKTIHVNANQVTLAFRQNWTLATTGVVKVPHGDTATLAALTAAQVGGKVVITELPDATNTVQVAAFRDVLRQVQALRPSLIVLLNRQDPPGTGGGPVQLIDLETARLEMQRLRMLLLPCMLPRRSLCMMRCRLASRQPRFRFERPHRRGR